MSAFPTGYDALREQAKDEQRERNLAAHRTDLVDIQRQLVRSRGRRENIAIASVCIVTAALVFGGWCVYHALKAKGLLP